MDGDRAVQLKVFGAVVTLSCSGDGSIHVDAGCAKTRAAIQRHIVKNGLDRGWTLVDALRLGRRLERKSYAQILNLDVVLAHIRAGWVKLLSEHLQPDPGHSYECCLNQFLARREFSVRIETHRGYALRCYGGPVPGGFGRFYLGDPKQLTVCDEAGRKRAFAWESITRITFSYYEPPQ